MWDSKKSLMLSKVCTVLAGVAIVGCMIYGPWLARWLIKFSFHASPPHFPLFMVTMYVGGAVALLLIFCLFLLLNNISRDEIFTAKNVRLLRHISWCCFVGAGITGASMLYYLPWGIVCIAAAFVGLIVRVVKNVIAQAIVLKEENDLTV